MYRVFDVLTQEEIKPGNLGHIICTAAYDKYNPLTLVEIIERIEQHIKAQANIINRPHIILSLTGSGVKRTINGLRGGHGIKRIWNKNEGVVICGSYFDTIEYDTSHIDRTIVQELDGGGYTLHAGIGKTSVCGSSVIGTNGSYPELNDIMNFKHHCLKYCSVCRKLVYNQ